MAVTLKNIAEELNLSVNTVSRALRNMPDIGQDTTHLVKKTAARLGYRKNLAARYLKVKKSMMFGIVITDICNPVFSSMYKGIEKCCMETDYTLMLGNSNENPDEEKAIISNMLDHGVEGIFLVPSMKDDDVITQLESAEIPYVLLQRKFPGIFANSVQSSDFDGGFLAAQHLYQLGHRKFLYVSGPKYVSSSWERYNGFLTFLKSKNLSEADVHVLECDNTRSDSYQVTIKWLEQHASLKKLSATAIFCFSDYVAYGVFSALAQKNLQVPEDISVIGYDNIEYSDIVRPTLTTIDIFPVKIGSQAARMMFELINSENSDEEKHLEILIAPKLVKRNSTGHPPYAKES